MSGKASDFTKYLNKFSQANNAEKIVMVDVHDIDPHPKNHYSIREIEVLASLIELQNGIQEPLFLKKNDNGRYLAISGQRRRLAMLLLLERKSETITSPLVPAIIRQYKSEKEEVFAIAAANGYREKTVEDKENEIEMMRPFVREEYDRKKAEGKELGKFRDYLAEKLNLSGSVVQRIESLKKLAPELREAIDAGNLDITPASLLTSLPKDEQKAIYDEVKQSFGKVTEKAIRETRQKRAANQSKGNEIDTRQEVSSVDKEAGAIDEIPEPEMVEVVPELHQEMETNAEDLDITPAVSLTDLHREEHENDEQQKISSVDIEVDGVKDTSGSETSVVEDEDYGSIAQLQEAKNLEITNMQKRFAHLKELYRIKESEGCNENEMGINRQQIQIVTKIIRTLRSNWGIHE